MDLVGSRCTRSSATDAINAGHKRGTRQVQYADLEPSCQLLGPPSLEVAGIACPDRGVAFQYLLLAKPGMVAWKYLHTWLVVIDGGSCTCSPTISLHSDHLNQDEQTQDSCPLMVIHM